LVLRAVAAQTLMRPHMNVLRRPAVRAAALASLLAIAGASTAVAMQVHERDASWTAPEDEASRPNPLASRPEAVAGGAKLFRQRCATCHGENGRGTEKAPDLTAADVQSQTDGALFWKIGSGNTRAGMPTFSFLPVLQRWQLVLQLRSVARSRT